MLFMAFLGKKKDEDMDSQHFATLERLRQTQRQDYLRGAVSGSVQATDRLMKELRDIYRSDSSKKGKFGLNMKSYLLITKAFFINRSVQRRAS